MIRVVAIDRRSWLVLVMDDGMRDDSDSSGGGFTVGWYW